MEAVQIDALRACDMQLNDISARFRPPQYFVPLNANAEKRDFFASNKSEPSFTYKTLDRDSARLFEQELRALNIPGEGLLSDLLAQRRRNLGLYLSAIVAKDNNAFQKALTTMMPLPSEAALTRAQKIIVLAKKWKKKNLSLFLSVAEAKEKVRIALDEFGLRDWKIEVREKQNGRITVSSRGIIFISKHAKFRESQLNATIAHEVGVHVLRAENGKRQPLPMFATATPGYLATEEGLGAIASRLHRENPYFVSIARSALTVAHAAKHSFRETFDYLHQEVGMSEHKAWQHTLRAKRGVRNVAEPGCHPRDAQYFSGVLGLEQYLKTGGLIRDLYIGKVSQEVAAQCHGVDEIQPAHFFPAFFDGAEKRILKILEMNR